MHGGGEPGITRVNLSPRMRLAEVIERIEGIPMGGTDCALPMLWAARNKLNVSGFVTYTDTLMPVHFSRHEPRCRPGLSQAWLRRFDSAFVSRSGCKHCSDAAVS